MKHLIVAALALFVVNGAFASQIDSKFIKDGAVIAAKIGAGAVVSAGIGADAVVAAKIRLENNSALRARNAADSADVNLFKLNASDFMEFSFFPLTPSSAPSANYQVANKKYVDDSISALPASKTPFNEVLTLAGGDITAQYIDSSQNCVIASAIISVGGTSSLIGTDVTLSTVSSKLRITFGTPYATGGVSELVAGDKIQLNCVY